jgi:LysR family transcriptional regulator, regulator for metE and metH
MHIRHLYMIREVARLGNLTRAAEVLFLSQSALSHQLHDAEDFFSTQIFIRQKKRLLLTEHGKLILETAEKILAAIDETKHVIDRTREENIGSLHIATACYTAYHWLPGLLQEYKRNYPNVDVYINPEATANVTAALIDNKIDIALTEENGNPKINYTNLFSDEFVAIVSKNHRLARLKGIYPRHFADENYIMYDIAPQKSTVYQYIFKNYFPKKLYRVPYTEAMMHMIITGMGIAVLPSWIATPFLRSGELVTVPFARKKFRRTWQAATLKSKTLPAYGRDFIAALKTYASQPGQMAN